MGSYLQKPVVQKESYEGTGQECGLQELGLTGSGAWIPESNFENKDHVNPIRDINGDQQQCKDGEQIWKIHISTRFDDFEINDVIKVFI